MYRSKKFYVFLLIILVLFIAGFSLITFKIKNNALDNEVSSNIETIKVSNKTLNGFTISWDDPEDMSNVSEYKVYLDNNLVSVQKEKSYIFDNLDNLNKYNVKIETISDTQEVINVKEVNSISTAKEISNIKEDTVFPEGTYYLKSDIPENITVVFEAGSEITLNSIVTEIKGTLKVEGTNEKRSTIKSGAYSIEAAETGSIDISGTDIELIGASYKAGAIIARGGKIKLDNVISEDDRKANVITYDVKEVEITNSELIKVQIENKADNGENRVKINSNKIMTIVYTPNKNSIAEIKNNVGRGGASKLEIALNNGAPDNIFENIEGNSLENENGMKIKIKSFPVNNKEMHLKGEKYEIATSELLENSNIVFGEGSQISWPSGTITINGTLKISGTSQKTCQMLFNTATLKINTTGKVYINNADLSNYTEISNSGTLYILNSKMSNVRRYAISSNGDTVLRYNSINGDVSGSKIDAKFNYWGAENGPKVQGQSPTGSGYKLSAGNEYIPFNKEYIKVDITFEEVLQDNKIKYKELFGKDGVDSYTGNYSSNFDDFNIEIPDVDLSLTRTYNSKDDEIGCFGRGWSFGLSSRIKNCVYTDLVK